MDGAPGRLLSRGLLVLALLLARDSAVADSGPALPGYRPAPVAIPQGAGYLTADGRVRVVGYNDMRELLERVAVQFSASHPAIHFEFELPGTRYAPAALARGQSAFAPMGAAFTPAQLAGYRALQAHDPVCLRVAHASLDPAALSGPLAVVVHEDNPVRALTPGEVSRIFSGLVTRWGEIGLSGPWRDRPIALYGLGPGTALNQAFSELAMSGASFAPQMVGLAQSSDVVARVAAEPGAIGFAAAMRLTRGTRAVPLAAHAGSEAVELTELNLVAGRYPLDRHLLVCVSTPVPVIAAEFLRLMLSREGQAAVAATPQRYLPLSASEAAAELRRLDESSRESSSSTSAAVSGK